MQNAAYDNSQQSDEIFWQWQTSIDDNPRLLQSLWYSTPQETPPQIESVESWDHCVSGWHLPDPQVSVHCAWRSLLWINCGRLASSPGYYSSATAMTFLKLYPPKSTCLQMTASCFETSSPFRIRKDVRNSALYPSTRWLRGWCQTCQPVNSWLSNKRQTCVTKKGHRLLFNQHNWKLH